MIWDLDIICIYNINGYSIDLKEILLCILKFICV